MIKSVNVAAENLDDGHQTDQGLLCDTLPSPVQSAQISCTKHTDEIHRHREMDRDGLT